MNGQLLWYLSRATGVVAMVLLTVLACTGIVTSGRRRPTGQRATVVMAAHRWLSVGMLVFLAATSACPTVGSTSPSEIRAARSAASR